MKKFTLILVMMLVYSGFLMAQTIEDFESIKMNDFGQGSTGKTSVVANPDKSGINTSNYVGKFHRAKDGNTYQGWYATLTSPINITTNRYVHVKVWKPRVSPTDFKVEGGAGNSGDTYPMVEASEINKWVEVVFDMTVTQTPASGEYVKIVWIPDFEQPAVTLTDDIDIYFDDMFANNDPAVGSAPVQVIENFEVIPINYMIDDPINDLSYMTLAPNPNVSGINLSDYVMKFNRDKDGLPWDGFWSKIADYSSAIDVTTNKYVHVKVLKPRISPIKFKIEGGPDGVLEAFSTADQTQVDKWEDMVFDFSSMSGAYPIIAFLPDFSDPVGLANDITIYFDDIRLNNDPTPMTPPTQIVQVDMNGATGWTLGARVFISGALGGVYGTWNTPGDNPNNEMADPDGDGIYTINMHLADGVAAFKFFLGTGWGTGDPYSGGDRTYNFVGNANLIYTWGVGGVETSIRDNKAGKIQMYPNPVRNELNVNSTSDISKVIITNTLGKVVGNLVYTNNKTINTTNLSKGLYFVTFVNADGTKSTQKLIKD